MMKTEMQMTSIRNFLVDNRFIIAALFLGMHIGVRLAQFANICN